MILSDIFSCFNNFCSVASDYLLNQTLQILFRKCTRCSISAVIESSFSVCLIVLVSFWVSHGFCLYVLGSGLKRSNGPVSAGQMWVWQGHVGTDFTSSHTLTLLKAFHRGTLQFPYCDAAAYISRAFMWPSVFSIWPYGPKRCTHLARWLISQCPIFETQIKGFCLSLVTSKLL